MPHQTDCTCVACRYRRGEGRQAPRLSMRVDSEVRDFLNDSSARQYIESRVGRAIQSHSIQKGGPACRFCGRIIEPEDLTGVDARCPQCRAGLYAVGAYPEFSLPETVTCPGCKAKVVALLTPNLPPELNVFCERAPEDIDRFRHSLYIEWDSTNHELVARLQEGHRTTPGRYAELRQNVGEWLAKTLATKRKMHCHELPGERELASLAMAMDFRIGESGLSESELSAWERRFVVITQRLSEAFGG